jgi:hypothetical protein
MGRDLLFFFFDKIGKLFLEVGPFSLLPFIMGWLRKRQVQLNIFLELTLFLRLPGLF